MQMFGVPPHLTNDITSWYDATPEAVAAAADTPETERAGQAPGKPAQAPDREAARQQIEKLEAAMRAKEAARSGPAIGALRRRKRNTAPPLTR
jgi:hypothetical protein